MLTRLFQYDYLVKRLFLFYSITILKQLFQSAMSRYLNQTRMLSGLVPVKATRVTAFRGVTEFTNQLTAAKPGRIWG